MKTLFVTVPQWYPMNPYSSSAILVGQLKASGLEACCRDLNIEFFNEILTRENVLNSANAAKNMLPELTKTFESCKNPEQNFNSYSKQVKTSLLRYKTIARFFDGDSGLVNETANKVENAVDTMKNPEKFYNPELHFKAKDVICDALQIISLPFAPSKILIDNYIANPVMSWSFEDVKAQCFDPSMNMFIDFFKKKLNSLINSNCGLIGISVADLSQLIPALTLGSMIKEASNIKVSLGGNYIYKIIADIKKQPDFFKLFCDYITVGDGETAAIELSLFVDGKIPVSEVHSLVYFSDEKGIVTNETAPKLKLNELPYPNFDDYDFNAYFSPCPVLPVQLGKGCYWSKCAFCDFYTGQQCFDIKSVNHAADEVEYLINRYKISHFIFVDEAVPPVFYDKFATEIKRRNLKIYFYSFARFDGGFTKEVLQNLYEAGARFFSWGYEVAPQRLLDLMNKGIKAEIRTRILNDCRDIGLWNQCTFLLGYPTETPEELQQTIDVIEDFSLINSCTPSNFVLKKNAILKDEAESVGLHNMRSNGDFHISCSYESDGISMDEVKKNRMEFQTRFLAMTADRLWSLGFTDTDHLLLYLSKYDRNWVRDYRLSYKKKQY